MIQLCSPEPTIESLLTKSDVRWSSARNCGWDCDCGLWLILNETDLHTKVKIVVLVLIGGALQLRESCPRFRDLIKFSNTRAYKYAKVVYKSRGRGWATEVKGTRWSAGIDPGPESRDQLLHQGRPY